jgi:hypothetical protein
LPDRTQSLGQFIGQPHTKLVIFATGGVRDLKGHDRDGAIFWVARVAAMRCNFLYRRDEPVADFRHSLDKLPPARIAAENLA